MSVFFCASGNPRVQNGISVSEMKPTGMQSLIDQCQRGNAFAQRRLYDQYVHRLYRVCLRYVRHEPEAEEVLMTAFLKIFRHLSGFTYRDDNGFEAWMRRIVVNEALLHLRQSRTLPPFKEDEPAVEPAAPGHERTTRQSS